MSPSGTKASEKQLACLYGSPQLTGGCQGRVAGGGEEMCLYSTQICNAISVALDGLSFATDLLI